MWPIKFYVFVYLFHTSGNKVRMYLFGIIYNQSIIYITYVERYVFGVGKMLYMLHMFILKVLQEYFGNCARDR
jgi:hypothetical protein